MVHTIRNIDGSKNLDRGPHEPYPIENGDPYNKAGIIVLIYE